jgi:hypothetical protein
MSILPVFALILSRCFCLSFLASSFSMYALRISVMPAEKTSVVQQECQQCICIDNHMCMYALRISVMPAGGQGAAQRGW